ncbi:hypothetical protein RCL_jg13398.t1 [Rhizophagus clarus]|uniref:Uncharacterized protein n=1 Tax=Rhizophagus clarus TaxID=94130 RepID=A0A8H3LS12_9GLOM|nr:hypothetical protein RCL_jg13398.t1 [Rhizophagus clarus]
MLPFQPCYAFPLLCGFASLIYYYFVKISPTCFPDGIPLHSVTSKTLSSGGISSSLSTNGGNSFLPVKAFSDEGTYKLFSYSNYHHK